MLHLEAVTVDTAVEVGWETSEKLCTEQTKDMIRNGSPVTCISAQGGYPHLPPPPNAERQRRECVAEEHTGIGRDRRAKLSVREV